MEISLHENNLYLDIEVTEDGDVRLLNLSTAQVQQVEQTKWHRLVELQESGLNQNDHHGSKHTGTQPGSLLRYQNHIIS